MKPKILIVSEFSDLSTGYAVYTKELLNELSKKYTVAELASYISEDDPRILNKNWKVYPVMPSRNNKKLLKEISSDQSNAFGKWRFEQTLLDFKPTHVISIRDKWFDEWIDLSPYRDTFNWAWLATVDAPSQHPEWMDLYSRCDGILTYNDWSKDTLEEESNGRIKVFGVAPPSTPKQLIELNKELIKEQFGLKGKYILGTVMRNQKRKLFPDLFKAFRQILDETERNDLLLYCHTSYPDQGWDIPTLLLKHGISSKVLFTYICSGVDNNGNQNCKYWEPRFFSDSNAVCPKCNRPTLSMSNVKTGLDTEQLCIIYNLFDLYTQYAILEGMGMPPVEAASCSVPVTETDFSAMKDVVRKLSGIPIEVKITQHEMETGRDYSIPDIDDFVKKVKKFFNRPKQLIKLDGKKAKNSAEKNYNWDKSIQTWVNYIESVDITPYEKAWKKERKILPEPPFKNGLSNRNLVKYILKNTFPRLLNSYIELKMVRQLNMGIIQNHMSVNLMDDTSWFGRNNSMRFTQEDCYNYFINMVRNYNKWENIRG